MERTIHNLLQGGRVPRITVEKILSGEGFVLGEINEEIEKLIKGGIVREWHGGRFISLTDV